MLFVASICVVVFVVHISLEDQLNEINDRHVPLLNNKG